MSHRGTEGEDVGQQLVAIQTANALACHHHSSDLVMPSVRVSVLGTPPYRRGRAPTIH